MQMITSQEGLVTPHFCSLGCQWELTTQINSTVLFQWAGSFPPNCTCTLLQPTSHILYFKEKWEQYLPQSVPMEDPSREQLKRKKKKKKRKGGGEKEIVRKRQGGQETLQWQGIGQAQAQEILPTALALAESTRFVKGRASAPFAPHPPL